MRGLPPQSTWHFDVVVTWLIKNVIYPFSQGLWTPNLAGWWLWMTGPHPQSYMTHWSRCYVTNQKRYISTFARPIDPNLAGWWLRMKEPQPQVRWHIDHMVTWQIKDIISPLSQGLWIPNLAGWGLKMKEPHPQVRWHIDHVVTWQIKDIISPL